jgi:transferase CAF17, mitochondrial
VHVDAVFPIAQLVAIMIIRQSRVPYVCAQCRRQQKGRAISRNLSSSARHAAPPPPPASGAARLTTRRLISLQGVDAPKFLQGLLTNNVQASGRQPAFYAAFLTGQGRVLNDVFVYPTAGSTWSGSDEPGYLVEVDADEVESLVKNVKKHKLRSKFKLRVLDEQELGVWSAWKEDERWTAHSQGSSGIECGELGIVDCRAPGLGQRLLLPPSSQSAGVLPASLEVEEAPLSAYTIRRYLRGVPEGQQEVPKEDSLPMNCNIDLMGGIDFKKGCYVGQELTIRTHHTGVVRRRILPVMLYEHGKEVPEKLEYDAQTAEILSENLESEASQLDIRKDDRRKKATGKLIASVGNVGLGMCRLEQMSDLTISGEASSFSPDDRFFAAAEGSAHLVGIKAFVPDWIRGRIRGHKVQRRVDT